MSDDRTTIHDLLERARARLRRLTPQETLAAIGDGAVVVDTRAESLRARQGTIPGSRHYPLSVLEWRMCPSVPGHDAGISFDHLVVIVCAEGYSSSLAAARLQDLGYHRATDLIGGVAAWRDAGLPLHLARATAC